MTADKEKVNIPVILNDIVGTLEQELIALEKMNDLRWRFLELKLINIDPNEEILDKDAKDELLQFIQTEKNEFKRFRHLYNDLSNRIILSAEIIKQGRQGVDFV